MPAGGARGAPRPARRGARAGRGGRGDLALEEPAEGFIDEPFFSFQQPAPKLERDAGWDLGGSCAPSATEGWAPSTSPSGPTGPLSSPWR